MAKDAIADLLSIMNDEAVSPRDRLNAAVSASRVSPLALPGEMLPPAVVYLRNQIDDAEVATNHRRESAAALAYYQRRVAKMALSYQVPDQAERRESWRRIINGALRVAMAASGRWPQDAHLLLGPNDPFEPPLGDPEKVLGALLMPAGGNRHDRRRLKAIDERVTGTFSGTEAERRELIKPLAELVHQRLAEFGVE